MLSTELGSDWNTLFDEFEFAPIAAASIGQVSPRLTHACALTPSQHPSHPTRQKYIMEFTYLRFSEGNPKLKLRGESSRIFHYHQRQVHQAVVDGKCVAVKVGHTPASSVSCACRSHACRDIADTLPRGVGQYRQRFAQSAAACRLHRSRLRVWFAKWFSVVLCVFVRCPYLYLSCCITRRSVMRTTQQDLSPRCVTRDATACA